MGSTFNSRERRTLVKLAGWGVTGLRRPGREPYMAPEAKVDAAPAASSADEKRPSAVVSARNGVLLPVR